MSAATQNEMERLRAERDSAVDQVVYWRERALGAEGREQALAAHVERLQTYGRRGFLEEVSMSNEARWTPGPWKHTLRNAHEIMTTFHGVQIGRIYIDVTTDNEAEDASLIAAAPEMAAYIKERADSGCKKAAELWRKCCDVADRAEVRSLRDELRHQAEEKR